MNVLIVEDHKLVSDGIKLILEASKDIRVVGSPPNAEQALEILNGETLVDIILSDNILPGMSGIKLCKAITHTQPKIKVIILSMIDDDQAVVDAMSAGAMGYVLKSAKPWELVYSIQHVYHGDKYLSADLSMKFFNQLYGKVASSSNVVNVSSRQSDVLSLIAQGLTSTEISNKLFLSKRTIEGYRKDLFEKTGAKNTAALIHYAVANRLIK